MIRIAKKISFALEYVRTWGAIRRAIHAGQWTDARQKLRDVEAMDKGKKWEYHLASALTFLGEDGDIANFAEETVEFMAGVIRSKRLRRNTKAYLMEYMHELLMDVRDAAVIDRNKKRIDDLIKGIEVLQKEESDVYGPSNINPQRVFRSLKQRYPLKASTGTSLNGTDL